MPPPVLKLASGGGTGNSSGDHVAPHLQSDAVKDQNSGPGGVGCHLWNHLGAIKQN